MAHKLVLSAGLVAASFACTSAFAWVAIAFDAKGNSQLAFGFDSAQAAGAAAMNACQAKFSSECKVQAVAARTAMVVAKGAGGWGQAADPDPQRAVQKATEECGKHAKGCRLVQAVWDAGPMWTALAIGADTYHLTYNELSRSAAESAALQGCRKTSKKPDSCKLDVPMTTALDEDIAVAVSKTSLGVGRGSDKDAAQKQAKALCARAALRGSTCALQAVVHNLGPLPRPKSMDAIQRMAGAASEAEKSQRQSHVKVQ